MHIPINTGLKDIKHGYPKVALSLAGAVVKCTLTLLQNKALIFEVIPVSGKDKKKATRDEKWKANILGEMFKKDYWGHKTVQFMQSIEGIPPKVWDEILDATLQFVKETMQKSGCGTSSNDDDSTRAPGNDGDNKYTNLMMYH